MNSENSHAHRTCRTFVLVIFGVIVIAFLLVVGMFHRPAVGNHKPFSTATPAHKK
jgi:hypothetical protein